MGIETSSTPEITVICLLTESIHPSSLELTKVKVYVPSLGIVKGTLSVMVCESPLKKNADSSAFKLVMFAVVVNGARPSLTLNEKDASTPLSMNVCSALSELQAPVTVKV